MFTVRLCLDGCAEQRHTPCRCDIDISRHDKTPLLVTGRYSPVCLIKA
jgi:hypothetical protein